MSSPGLPALELVTFRPLAFALAVFWSLQILICLAPVESPTTANTEIAREAVASSSVDQAARGAEHVGCMGHSKAPDSQPDPASDNHCAQHCASLSQAIIASAVEAPHPTLSEVAVVPIPTVVERPRVLADVLARVEFGRPPPDLVIRNATLLI